MSGAGDGNGETMSTGGGAAGRGSKVPQGPAIRCERLSRFLGEEEGRVQVLREVSFEVSPGTITAIVGPSGCGKSTLLYLLGLLDRPDGGEIWLAGRNLAQAGDDERTLFRNEHIGFVFQFHFLMLEFTALENVMMPMRKLGRLSPARMVERARALLASVGLAEKTHRLASHLSGGEQQRVAIARALANQPSLILADEPTGNLDAKNSGIVFDLMTRLARENGQAVVLVTHNPEIANRCDSVRPMRDGVFI